MKIKASNSNTPNWKEVNVKSRVPEELSKLSSDEREEGDEEEGWRRRRRRTIN